MEADKCDLQKVRAMFGRRIKLKVSLTALTQTSRADRVGTRQRPRLLWLGPEDRKHPNILNSILASPSRSMVAEASFSLSAGQTLTSQACDPVQRPTMKSK